MSAVLEAVKQGQPERLSALLGAQPQAADQRDEHGTPLLVIATFLATCGGAIPTLRGTPESRAVLRVLLDAGADPDAADASGATALHDAARCGHADLVALLRRHGASLRGRLLDTDGGTPLALALFYARHDMAEHLLPVVPDNLRHAAAMGRPLEPYLHRDGALTEGATVGLDFYRPSVGFPVWERTYGRQEVVDEALTWASRNGQIDGMQQLVRLGADPNHNPYRGTPLLWAVYADDADATTWLLDHGADPDLRHDFGGAEHGTGAVAMHLAAQFGGLRCLRVLLERGADATVVDEGHGGTPLEWAEFSEQHEAAELLRRHLR